MLADVVDTGRILSTEFSGCKELLNDAVLLHIAVVHYNVIIRAMVRT